MVSSMESDFTGHKTQQCASLQRRPSCICTLYYMNMHSVNFWSFKSVHKYKSDNCKLLDHLSALIVENSGPFWVLYMLTRNLTLGTCTVRRYIVRGQTPGIRRGKRGRCFKKDIQSKKELINVLNKQPCIQCFMCFMVNLERIRVHWSQEPQPRLQKDSRWPHLHYTLHSDRKQFPSSWRIYIRC